MSDTLETKLNPGIEISRNTYISTMLYASNQVIQVDTEETLLIQ